MAERLAKKKGAVFLKSKGAREALTEFLNEIERVKTLFLGGWQP